MSPARTLLSAAIALTVVACTDTPTAVDVTPLFSRSEVAGAVTIIQSDAIRFFTDQDKGLRVSIGFDRQLWCAHGNPTGPIPRPSEYRWEELDGQLVDHGNEYTTALFNAAEGILVVYELPGGITDCSTTVVGQGTGKLTLRETLRGGPNPSAPPDTRMRSIHGSIETPDGTKQVRVLRTSVRLDAEPGILHRNGDISVQGLPD